MSLTLGEWSWRWQRQKAVSPLCHYVPLLEHCCCYHWYRVMGGDICSSYHTLPILLLLRKWHSDTDLLDISLDSIHNIWMHMYIYTCWRLWLVLYWLSDCIITLVANHCVIATHRNNFHSTSVIWSIATHSKGFRALILLSEAVDTQMHSHQVYFQSQ